MSKLYVYMFRSRNKDNKNIEGFKERVKTIVEYEENENKVLKEFHTFAAAGLPGEKTRLYKSVNARNEEKIREELIIRLLRDKPPVNRFNALLASVAQQVQNRAESKWLFDFDEKDEELLDEFVKDIPVDTSTFETPNGFAIVCERGFDTRPLMRKWMNYDITLKKDELLFISMEET